MEHFIKDEAFDRAIDVIQVRIDNLKGKFDDSILIDMIITELESLIDEIEDLKYYREEE